jgi:hypothetical protein
METKSTYAWSFAINSLISIQDYQMIDIQNERYKRTQFNFTMIGFLIDS